MSELFKVPKGNVNLDIFSFAEAVLGRKLYEFERDMIANYDKYYKIPLRIPPRGGKSTYIHKYNRLMYLTQQLLITGEVETDSIPEAIAVYNWAKSIISKEEGFNERTYQSYSASHSS
jgi:hypothetical protein